MSGRANQVNQMAAMTRVIEVAPHAAAALRAHLQRIIESPAFRGSRRSQEFLQFIVEHALDRHFDELKERTLGVALFGRSPSYDTGDDAIVRVTACDVRKRLTQFYAEFGFDSEFRVELPPGSYIPEFKNMAAALSSHPGKIETAVETVKIPPASAAEAPAKSPVPETVHGRRIIWLPAAILAGLAILTGVFWWNQRRVVSANISPSHVLPWSGLIQASRQTHVIFCDPELVTLQRLLNSTVSLSDYANQRYSPAPAEIKPEVRHIMEAVSFRGANVAAVDAAMALQIDNLIVPSTKRSMEMHTARSMRLGDFKTEDSFVLFGSPRSNPWVELFQDQLDFGFEFDGVRRAEFIRNKRPQNGEAATYVPTAEGWGTGQAYAIIALVGNPGQTGRVLLLAGSNAEATEAAGKLATNLDALSKALRARGIDPNGPPRPFEILLRVSTMAGSPNTSEVIACHILKPRA